MKRALIAFLLIAAGSATRAQDVTMFWGDDASCAAWTKTAGNKAMRAYYEFWIRGFVSGQNFASPSRQVAVGDLPGGDALYEYIDRYCTQNPKAMFMGAAISMVEQLRKPVTAPKASPAKGASKSTPAK
jgi:hypothetical protein